MSRIIGLFLVLLINTLQAQPVTFQPVPVKVKSSFRALSIPDGTVAWIAGSRGWIGRSIDGGDHWTFFRILGDSTSDYRTLYAHDSLRAVVGNTGSPAVIRETLNGGRTWNEVYRNEHPDAFLDGIGFWDRRNGIIYGDPINGRLLLLKTTDGGHTWNASPDDQRPAVIAGEASFAASGTTIRCDGKRSVWIATGGSRASLFHSRDRGNHWSRLDTPMAFGKPGAGTFSICLTGTGTIALAGGDYQAPERTAGNYCLGTLPGDHWVVPSGGPSGYRSSIEMIGQGWLLAGGPGGADLSMDGGRSWQLIPSPEGLNVFSKSRSGKLLLAGGRNGIWKVVFPR